MVGSLKENLILREKQRLIIARAVKNVDHFDRILTDPIEDQIVAERAAANAFVFVARHQRIAPWRICKGFALFP